MKNWYWVLGILGIFLLFSGCKSAPDPTIRVAVAANAQFAAAKMIEVYTQETGVACELIIASSGKLTAQIQEGAPYDVFLAADMKYPQHLFDTGVAMSPPRAYALGQLVLWSTQLENVSVSGLQENHVQKIAVSNPKIAPYGVAAMQVLNHYGVTAAVADKLVYGESVAQTNQFINSGAVQVGFTAKAVVVSPELRQQGVWVPIPQTAYQPIKQGAVLINRNQSNAKEVQRFYTFLFSPQAHKILKDFGYLIP